MNQGSKSLRWLKIIALGCALGLFLVTADLLLPAFFGDAYPGGNARSAPLFRLSADPVKQQLTGVINSQLSAFRQDDFAGAHGFADSVLRAQVSPSAFEKMVKSAYPDIARSKSASFGFMVDNGTEAFVTVGITSRSGRRLQYRYLLRHEPAGWRISGVVRIRPEGMTI